LSEDELAAVLKRSRIEAYTARTVTDRGKLEQIIRDDRRKGWSLVNQELEDGLVSISVPLINRAGRIVAAMNVSCQASRTSATDVARNFLPVLKRASDQINTALRFRPA
jgi:IclR family pca regulon transcriptional regulator